jgi:hypothetical protein
VNVPGEPATLAPAVAARSPADWPGKLAELRGEGKGQQRRSDGTVPHAPRASVRGKTAFFQRKPFPVALLAGRALRFARTPAACLLTPAQAPPIDWTVTMSRLVQFQGALSPLPESRYRSTTTPRRLTNPRVRPPDDRKVMMKALRDPEAPKCRAPPGGSVPRRALSFMLRGGNYAGNASSSRPPHFLAL